MLTGPAVVSPFETMKVDRLALRDLNACDSSRGPKSGARGPSAESAGEKENALGLAKAAVASFKREGHSSDGAAIARDASARFRAIRTGMLEAAAAADGTATTEPARYDGAASAPAGGVAKQQVARDFAVSEPLRVLREAHELGRLGRSARETRRALDGAHLNLLRHVSGEQRGPLLDDAHDEAHAELLRHVRETRRRLLLEACAGAALDARADAAAARSAAVEAAPPTLEATVDEVSVETALDEMPLDEPESAGEGDSAHASSPSSAPSAPPPAAAPATAACASVRVLVRRRVRVRRARDTRAARTAGADLDKQASKPDPATTPASLMPVMRPRPLGARRTPREGKEARRADVLLCAPADGARSRWAYVRI